MARNEEAVRHFLRSVVDHAQSADPVHPLSAAQATEAVLHVLDRRAARGEDESISSFFAPGGAGALGGAVLTAEALRRRLNPMVIELASAELKTAFASEVRIATPTPRRAGALPSRVVQTRLLAPDAMMRCVLRATELVANALRISSSDSQQVGADEFLPAFIAVVVHATLTSLVLPGESVAPGGEDPSVRPGEGPGEGPGEEPGRDSALGASTRSDAGHEEHKSFGVGGAAVATCFLAQLEYIDRLRDPASLMGSEGYVLASLQTAAEVLLRHALVFAGLSLQV